MLWKAFEKLKERITGKPAGTPEIQAGHASPAPGKGDAQQVPDLKDLEKKGMLGQFFRHWKNPAFLRQVQAIAARMKADGVDLKDAKAVQAWVTAHKDDLASGADGEAPQKQVTFVKTEPKVGRNDPCTCGSQKKYKKCCGVEK